MTPGPDQIIACPHCRGLARHFTLNSGNTFGVRIWTDGKQVAPMLPRLPIVVKCRHCSEFYWLNDAAKVGTLSPWGDDAEGGDPAWQTAEHVEQPTAEEYHRAIDQKIARDVPQERLLRLFTWWRDNDAFREDSGAKATAGDDRSEASRANMQAYAGLLVDTDDNDRIMKAEIHRELGDFSAALALLDQIQTPHLAPVVAQIRTLCESGETGLRELSSEK